MRLILLAGIGIGWAGYAAAGSVTVISTFHGKPDGAAPEAGLVADKAGNLYGVTIAGGTTDSGTVFQLIPPGHGVSTWRRRTLYNFAGGADGGEPQSRLVIDRHNNLYGTFVFSYASQNGGVFEISPPASGKKAWTETVLHTFNGNGDGATPDGALIMDARGNLYGTTQQGSVRNAGSVFELSPPAAGQTAWTQTILQNFTYGTYGGNPFTGVVMNAAGSLYGTTSQGGDFTAPCTYGCGTVFRLDPPAPPQTYSWTMTVLHYFTGGADGSTPEAALILDKNGVLYGTTAAGGTSGKPGAGTVFSVANANTGSAVERVLYAFQGQPDGDFPVGSVILDSSGNLLGATTLGGAAGKGSLFRLSAPAPLSAETSLVSLDGVAANQPWSTLLPAGNGAYYGTTAYGGGAAACFGGCGTVILYTP